MSNKENEKHTNLNEQQSSHESRHGKLYEYNDDFFEKLKNNRFWPVRVFYTIVSAVWTIVVVIGGFIAWLVSVLFL